MKPGRRNLCPSAAAGRAWVLVFFLVVASLRAAPTAPLVPGDAGSPLPDLVAPAAPRPLPRATPAGAIVLGACAIPALLWLGLAVYRVRRSDPLRAQKRGQASLHRLFRHLQGRSLSRRELELWRKFSVEAWGLSQAEPNRNELTAPMTDAAVAAAWARLWEEAERALFSAHKEAPADWVPRARSQLGNFPALARTPSLPTKGQHWWPRVAAMTCGVMGLLASRLNAETMPAFADFRAGHFAAARKLWSAAAAGQPGDWSTRHNLALCWARENQWGAAAAHWTAAFLLNPRNAQVARGFALGLSKLEAADPVLRRLAGPGVLSRLAVQAPIATWQRSLWLAGGALCAGFAAFVGCLYGEWGLAWRRTALGLAAAGALGLALGAAALRQFGPLTQPTAALVTRPAELRSIPSDLVAREQTSTLTPGTIVAVNRSFLGWDQVTVNGDVAGWARTESLVWLYRARDETRAATIQAP